MGIDDKALRAYTWVMLRFAIAMLCFVGLTGCGVLPVFERREAPEPVPPQAAPEEPEPITEAPPPPENARTAAQFDTTTDAERVAAVQEAQETSGSRKLGDTIASLGAVAEPGIWMKTPLVSAPTKGRVSYPAKGTSVALDLIPLEGDAGAGSQLSLAAMRLLDADLTALPEVEVFAAGG